MSNEQKCRDIIATNLKKFSKIEDKEIKEIVENIPILTYKKGEVLLRQGFKPDCSAYYILKGCVRQYSCDENGREATVNFYTEEEPIGMFGFLDDDGLSLYSLACIEECMMVICSGEADDDDEYDIKDMERMFLEKQFGDMQTSYKNFKMKSPEERFAMLAKERPELLNRVPQIHLASYLGITPEAFSRIKKRLKT